MWLCPVSGGKHTATCDRVTNFYTPGASTGIDSGLTLELYQCFAQFKSSFYISFALSKSLTRNVALTLYQTKPPDLLSDVVSTPVLLSNVAFLRYSLISLIRSRPIIRNVLDSLISTTQSSLLYPQPTPSGTKSAPWCHLPMVRVWGVNKDY